ncbi:MAG: T9SS type A sorting domain-containing protein [Bacteroidia bacterium]
MKGFLLAIFSLLIFTLKAQVYTAGTVYTQYADIAPDKLITYQATPYTHMIYDLNIFGDSTSDIEFIAHGAVSSGGAAAYLAVIPLDSNLSIRFGRFDSVFVPATSSWYITKVAKPLNNGDAINGTSALWDDTLLYMTDHSGSGGGNKNVNDFIGGDRYVGLWYQNGASSWYGWIRVNCITQDSVYIKDYSYALGSVDISEKTEPVIQVYPNPANDLIRLEASGPALDQEMIRLTDLSGAEVPADISRTRTGFQISLAALSPGVYLLSYHSSDSVITKKIIKTKLN